MKKAIKKPERHQSPRFKRGYAMFEGYWIPTTLLKGVLTQRPMESVHDFNFRQAEANFLITRGWKPVGKEIVRQAGPFGGSDRTEVFWRTAYVPTPIPQTLAALIERGESKLL